MKEILFRGKPLSRHTLIKQNSGWVYGVPVLIKVDANKTDRIYKRGSVTTTGPLLFYLFIHFCTVSNYH